MMPWPWSIASSVVNVFSLVAKASSSLAYQTKGAASTLLSLPHGPFCQGHWLSCGFFTSETPHGACPALVLLNLSLVELSVDFYSMLLGSCFTL
jgi:hypothetical protein